MPGLAEAKVAPVLAEEEIDVRLPELWIHEQDGLRKVLNVQIVSEEVIFFTAYGLYVATRKGCAKLSK